MRIIQGAHAAPSPHPPQRRVGWLQRGPLVRCARRAFRRHWPGLVRQETTFRRLPAGPVSSDHCPHYAQVSAVQLRIRVGRACSSLRSEKNAWRGTAGKEGAEPPLPAHLLHESDSNTCSIRTSGAGRSMSPEVRETKGGTFGTEHHPRPDGIASHHLHRWRLGAKAQRRLVESSPDSTRDLTRARALSTLDRPALSLSLPALAARPLLNGTTKPKKEIKKSAGHLLKLW